MATYDPASRVSMPVGYPGMVANGETSNRISRTVEDADPIPFGMPVFRGTGDHGCTQTQSGQFLGITIQDKTIPGFVPNGAAQMTPDTYPQYSTAAIMTQGVVWVTAGEAVTDGAQVYADADDGSLVDTSTDNTILTGWFFQDTVGSGELVRIAKR